MYEKIYSVIDEEKVKLNEPMSKHTTFRIGGVADIFVQPESIDEIKKTIKFAKDENIKLNIIGNGSKLLVRDGGIRGITIKLGNKFSSYSIDGNVITATAGVTLPYLSSIAKQNSLSGLEFACGIPATLGGAIFQNAGAYDGDMAAIIEEVTYLDENNELHTKGVGELEFGYRTSFFKKNPKNIVISAKLKLTNKNRQDIEQKMKENSDKRKEKQPLEYPSAGSTFKRPEGYFAAKLIEDAGLKGYRVGDAQISTKHSGFIVNVGNATAKDVISLVEHIKSVVYDKFNIMLEEEMIIIGEEIE